MNRTLSFLVSAALLTAVGFAVPARAAGPREQVSGTVDAIIAVLKDQEISSETRKEKVDSMVRAQFDFRTMSQGVLATNWKKASDEEKNRFTELFAELLSTTYRERIDTYNNEKVRYVSEKIQGKKAIVETLVVTTDVEIPIVYKLVNTGRGWLAYDVVIEGVSLIRNYRDSYRDIVDKEGIDGLLVRMEEKILELRNTPER